MHLQDHDIVVEDKGILFRACVTAAALDALQRRAGCRQPAEVLIADNREELERLAIAGFRAGCSDINAAPVTIGPKDVEPIDRPDDRTGRSSTLSPRHWLPRGLFRLRRHRSGS